MMWANLARTLSVGIGLGAAVVSAACGGGAGLPPPPQISVSISPTTASVPLSGTQQFTAAVTATTNTAVTWSVNNVTGGSSQAGTISTAGLYTAPSPAPLPPPFSNVHPVPVAAGQQASGIDVALSPLIASNVVTVTATSQADSTKAASATVTITSLSLLAVGTCGTAQCTADYTGTVITQGQQVTLFVVGLGVVPGTSFAFSGPPDITKTATTFIQTDNGLPAAEVGVTVAPTAQLGPRNVVVTNSAGELSSIVGGLLITSGP